MESLVAKAKKHLQEELPLFLYCKPNTVERLVFFQRDASLFKLMILQKRICYFVFDGKHLLIPENESEIMRVSSKAIKIYFSEKQTTIDELAKRILKIW
jgi:hypothetical protein